MTPMTATQRQKVATLLCLAKVKNAARRATAEEGLKVWMDRAHDAGAPSLAAWMDGPTSTTDKASQIHARYMARNMVQTA